MIAMYAYLALFIDDGQDNDSNISVSADSLEKPFSIGDCAISKDEDTSGVKSVEVAAMKQGYPEVSTADAGLPHSQNNQGYAEEFPKADDQHPTAPCETFSPPTPTEHPILSDHPPPYSADVSRTSFPKKPKSHCQLLSLLSNQSTAF
jgi:hypothetical protein